MSAEMTTIGRVQVRRWPAADPKRLVVLVHGYGEHIGRYEHVAEALTARGSTVLGPDHIGRGRSPGERALVESFESIVDDVRGVVQAERGELPVVMVGHSMGGLIATRYAQRHGAHDRLAPLALARPMIERLAGPNSDLHVIEGARHEVFNEIGKEEVIDLL